MPRITAIIALVVGVVLAAVFIRPGGEPAEASEVILQPTNATGPDPFTPSTANTTSSLPAAAPSTPSTETNAIRSVAGSEPGVYGGSRNLASCDVEKQIRYLSSDRAKNKAFASVLNVRESEVPGYLRSLTPVQLRSDTRVTSHGFRDGTFTKYQAVLQAGTAVLVDGRGEPKVRCACGNPLARAVAQKGTPEQKGSTWTGYRPQDVVVIKPAPAEVKEFVIFDQKDKDWVSRSAGDHGERDKQATPPDRQWPLMAETKQHETKHDDDKKDDKKEDGKKDDDKKDKDKEDGKKDDDKKDKDKDKEDGKKDDKKEDGKKDDKKEDGKKDEDKKDEQKKDEQKKDEQKKDEQKKDEQKKDEQKKDEQKKEEQKKDEQKKDEQKKDEQNKDDKEDVKKPDPKEPKSEPGGDPVQPPNPEDPRRLVEPGDAPAQQPDPQDPPQPPAPQEPAPPPAPQEPAPNPNPEPETDPVPGTDPNLGADTPAMLPAA
ncbi:DUF6777 domain-containing protein [Streptomyces sp. 5K101]|uniref:DUF6777 domain-containing protein n=1 Tax=Streptomyces sp. 5K101 TaxID=3390037 RepID=UPI0039756699